MWYVVQVSSGTEERIRRQCERIVDASILKRCFVPYYEQMKRYQGQWHKERKILFPGYVFMVSDALEELFGALKTVHGLTKLIGTGEEIVPLSEEEVAFLKRLGGEEQTVEMSQGILEGGRVVITDGPLQGMEGNIKKIDRHKRTACLEVHLMGRLVETWVGVEIVEKKLPDPESVRRV